MAEQGKSAIFAFHYRSVCSEHSEQDALFRRGYSYLDFVTTAPELMERHAALPHRYDLYRVSSYFATISSDQQIPALCMRTAKGVGRRKLRVQEEDAAK